MSISLDGTTPVAVDLTSSTAASVTSASFSPPAGCLIVLAVNIGFFGDANPVTLTAKDSLNNSYTAGPFVNNTNGDCASGIFWRYYAAAPGSITVSATRTVTQQALFELVTYVLDGASSVQTGAGSNTTSSSTGSATAFTGSITTKVTGSWSIVATVLSSFSGTESFTAVGIAAGYHNFPDSTDSSNGLSGHAVTGTPGPTTLGWNGTIGSDYSWAALEILPPTASSGASVQVRAKSQRAQAGRTASRTGPVRNPNVPPPPPPGWAHRAVTLPFRAGK